MIPADLLGNMWAQEWGNVYDLVAPTSAPPSYDIGEILQQRKTTAKQVVQYGEGFFRSIGTADAAGYLLGTLAFHTAGRSRRGLSRQRMARRL